MDLIFSVCCSYGLRYTAKVLRDALRTKFPEASEDELYKVNTCYTVIQVCSQLQPVVLVKLIKV